MSSFISSIVHSKTTLENLSWHLRDHPRLMLPNPNVIVIPAEVTCDFTNKNSLRLVQLVSQNAVPLILQMFYHRDDLSDTWTETRTARWSTKSRLQEMTPVDEPEWGSYRTVIHAIYDIHEISTLVHWRSSVSSWACPSLDIHQSARAVKCQQIYAIYWKQSESKSHEMWKSWLFRKFATSLLCTHGRFEDLAKNWNYQRRTLIKPLEATYFSLTATMLDCQSFFSRYRSS